ncbi:MAG TPA: dihydrolipoamide acetyltransferase family protein [Flavobacteriales bacterium]|nr:2-oxo acid dehydrogenase subunit E2 [Flavobacteriales bacterium]HNI04927.1 dihydrolipoamide acetyltransferase family protein [Flavobacteriales bacterium]
MAEIVRMPKLSDTMTEGVVAKWSKKVGDKVKSGDILAEIETDKATMEFESYTDGVLLHIGVEQGKAAPVDSVLAVLGAAGEDITALLAEAAKTMPAPVAAPSPKKVEAPKAAPPAAPVPVAPAASTKPVPVAVVANGAAPAHAAGDKRVKASPLAKHLAEEKGIDIGRIRGTGPEGRITKADVEGYTGGGMASVGPQVERFTEVPVSQMRKTIARRLAESKFSAPHFYLTIELDMSRAMQVREAINASIAPDKVSFNDLVIKAVALSLKRHPKVNSSWLGDPSGSASAGALIRTNEHVHIGVAVAVEEGLLVPVVRFADGKALRTIGAEVRDFAKRAKEKKLQPQDWEGNTFTISNLGMFGIDEFTAIINPPDACIMAVGAILEKPVVRNGTVVPGHTMKVTLSCDHRVVDGATGAAFLNTFKQLLEEPALLLGQGAI